MSNVALRAKAMDYLTRRDHSRFELQNKLLKKQFDPDEIKTLLNELDAKGFLDDARVAENYVQQRRRAGFGPKRVAHELEIRGVSKKIIHDKVDSHSIEWRRHMVALIARRYPKDVVIDPLKKARFLSSRGFLSEEIFRYLNIDRLEENE